METGDAARPHGDRARQVDTLRRAIGPEAGARIKAARRRAGLGLRPTARRAAIGHGYLAAIERGERSPSGRVAERLIEALRLDPATAALLRDEGELVDEGRERRAAEREQRGRRGRVARTG